MNVVQILYSGLGGHSSVAFSLIEADKEKKHAYSLIFYGIEDLPENYKDRCLQNNTPYTFIKKKTGFDVEAQKAVIKALKQIKPDIIILHSVIIILPVYWYTFGKKVKLLSIEHQSNHLKTKMEWLWSFFVMRLSKHTVYLTEKYREQMQNKLGIFYNAKKVKVINNGINTGLFKEEVSVVNFNKPVIKLGMLGRLTAIKDFVTLIKAFSILLQQQNNKNIQLLIAGDGETKQQLEKLTAELNIKQQVMFLGLIPENETPAFLNSLDIYVHASLGETMSTAVMQAMAGGKPILASDVNGLNNMIEHNVTGLLVPPKNAEALSNAILQLLNNPQQAAELGHNAFTFAATHYSSKTMFDKYSSLF